MAFLEYTGIGIDAIASVVPCDVVRNESYDLIPKEDVERIIKKTGIKERRFARPNVCASDLATFAAKCLFADGDVNPDDVDFLIFVTQTPDFKMPFSAALIQNRLGLSKSVGAFDVNLGCSGFVYGLSLAFSLANSPGVRKVLLLNGETRSKVYSPRDRGTALLFGDAASAVVVGAKKGVCRSVFSLNTDGSGGDLIMIPAGGYRNPSSTETLKVKTYEDGSERSDEQGCLDGVEVFNFSISTVPQGIREILDHADVSTDDLDYAVFHQANRMMTDVIAKKLGLSREKVPYSLDKYGNTSSVSIPLTISSELHSISWADPKRLLLSGFGVGLSWANAIIEVDGLRNLGVFEL